MEPNAFRIEVDEFRAWHQAVAARMDARGAPAVAKEMESHLQRKLEGGHVVVPRHTLFSWAETLSGVAARDPRAASAGMHLSLAQVADDMRRTLGGKPPAQPGLKPMPTPPAAAASSYGSPQQAYTTPYTPSTPSRSYGPLPTSSKLSSEPTRLLGPGEVGEGVRALMRAAQAEVLIVSPWTLGLDGLVDEIARLSTSVRVRCVTRRPEREEEVHRRAYQMIEKRGAEIVFSPHLQTRMVIVDGARMCLGAASIPQTGGPSREVGLLTSDAEAVRKAREHFERVLGEARGAR